MKRYVNKKIFFLLFILIILATILSAYLNSIGYKGMLYFQTVYTTNGHHSHGSFSPRTGGFLMTGLIISYSSFIWKKGSKSDTVFIRRTIGTLFIMGITIFSIGGIDLISAILFILNR